MCQLVGLLPFLEERQKSNYVYIAHWRQAEGVWLFDPLLFSLFFLCSLLLQIFIFEFTMFTERERKSV